MKYIAPLLVAIAIAASASVPASATGCTLDDGNKAFFDCISRERD